MSSPRSGLADWLRWIADRVEGRAAGMRAAEAVEQWEELRVDVGQALGCVRFLAGEDLGWVRNHAAVGALRLLEQAQRRLPGLSEANEAGG